MGTPLSGYVQLTVLGRRFIGTWSALSNVVVHSSVLQDANVGFSIPVNHILRNGAPNRFPAIRFKRRVTFTIIDTKLLAPSKPIRVYEASEEDVAEMSEDHFKLLLQALTEHGCCEEQKEDTYHPTFSHLKKPRPN